nr:GAP family protein [Nocardioides sambongensis]
MATLDKVSPLVALGLGAALSGLNPKNLALAVSGAVAIASNELGSAQTITCVVVFVVIASALVAGPVIAFLVGGQAMAAPLNALKTFMQDHNSAIMTVLLGVLALSSLGQGIGGLLS